MKSSSRSLGLILVLSSLLFAACATVYFERDIADYRDEIAELEAKIAFNPNDAEAQRDLGVIYFETANYARAESYLQQAYSLNPNDPKTMFYHGISLEFLKRILEAQKIYQRFDEVSRLSSYRRLMQGRYHQLTREIVGREIRALIQQEERLGADRLQPNTIAIFPLGYEGKDKQFEALGRGLSEMMITDLGQVGELRLLERIRLQTLLQELELAESDVVDRQTAPRVGKLLSAGRILAGSFNVSRSSQLDVDLVSWDIVNQNLPDAVSHSGRLNDLLRMEKELVFGVIRELGVDITPEERQNIQRIPTQNIQAFLAYCRGLQEEDAGRFDAALRFYQTAIQLDPGFQAALSQSETAESLSRAGGTTSDVLNELAVVEGKVVSTGTSAEDLIDSRLRNLGESIGSNFVPGQDSRKSVEEADEAGVLGELAEPPPPPPPPRAPKSQQKTGKR